MAKGYGRGRRKSGGFNGNLSKLGGSKRKLTLKSDMMADNMAHGSMKTAHKQPHKKV
jgi:hypothetical protein